MTTIYCLALTRSRSCRLDLSAWGPDLAAELSSFVRNPPIAGVRSACDCALMSTNRQFQCCYSDKAIEPTDRAALRITVTGLWSSADGTVQDLFAHSKCAADKLAGNLSQWVPFDVEAFHPDD